jgi:hypothetical protein
LTKYNALIHRAITKIAPPNSYSRLRTLLLALPIAAVALFAASALSACSKEVLGAPIEDMEYFYGESLGLKSVAGDSIQRFATKVDYYVYCYPETKDDPYYEDIISNIEEASKLGGFSIVIYFDPTWEGETEYYY